MESRNSGDSAGGCELGHDFVAEDCLNSRWLSRAEILIGPESMGRMTFGLAHQINA